ncbi:TonB-dependent receptor [Pseudomaricurvus alkylphenolicus]|uniref:TonB-dependent receptor n=1 Tax=Pseudomaricurvus alkylphenolicus TaxID=1306991 RepID=UPI001420AD73|nr:TonB-dependent receptor [Pseudomaricurvus alkylphenolicus]NIB43375.1 TonB-dependent receptor [Pseudomaricurvus alkylphenolicus]
MKAQIFARNTIASALMTVVGGTMTPAVSQAAQIEEVIVTAQKRQESSQDIGLAITALDSDRLINSDVNNIQDLQNMAPSVQIGESFGFAQVMVRGIGTDNPFAGGDPSVGMHFDGVVTGQSSAQFGSLFDIDRVEVLRGPQGTLYGRNTTGGSVNVITNKPTEELSGYARASLGNYDLVKFEGAIAGPLSDNVQARLAIRSVDRGGYGENIADGGDIDDADQQSIRGQLHWGISDTMDLRLAIETHEEDDANYIPKFRAASYDPAPLPALEPQPASGVRASDPRDINSNVNLQNRREQSSYTLEYNWEINESLSLVSITNYQDFDKVPQADFDMTAEDFYIWSESFETEQISEELRLNFEGDKVRGLAGLYYYKEEISSDNRLDLDLVPQFVIDADPGLSGCGFDDNVSNQIVGAAVEDLCFLFRGTSDTEAYAAFANVAYDLAEDWTLNLGARYSYEKKEGNTDHWTAPGAPVLSFADEKSFNEFSPSVRLEWHAAEDVMLYASFSEGFKSGIFLSGQRSPVLEPEIVDAFEIGLKGVFLERQLQFNAAAFYYDFTDLQQGRSVPAGSSGFTLVYENAASAEIEGVEAEFTWLPNDNLTIFGSATILDAVFDDYVSTDPFDTVYQQLGLIDASVDLSQQLSGNRMVQSPELSWTLGATLDFMVPGTEWAASATVSASFKDDIYFSQFNHEELGQEDVTTVNANFLLTSPNEKWTLNAWGKNLTDETLYMGTFILNSSRTNAGFMAPPKTYGVTLGYRF